MRRMEIPRMGYRVGKMEQKKGDGEAKIIDEDGETDFHFYYSLNPF